MSSFTFNTAKSVVFRSGAAAELGKIVGTVAGRSCLLVTDPGICKLKLCDPAIASLEAAGLGVTVFANVEQDPSQATLLAAIQAGRDAGVTSVIGFGGGSSLDIAKVCALILGSGEALDKVWGAGNAKGPRLPLVLVPTTAGTGSEVTPVAIITVGAEEKRAVSSPLLLPDIAVLDAQLTLGLPAAITAATGIDAMVHAIESYASKSPNNSVLTRALARQALRMLGAHIETAVHDGRNEAAREGMLLGSMIAGQSFANASVGAVHALAYPVGGGFHVPHGVSNALVLPHVLRFNAPSAAAVYAEIAADVFPDLKGIDSTEARCTAFIDGLAALTGKVGVPTRLRDVGIPQSALPKMAADAMINSRILANNARTVTEQDALSIYQQAW